MTTAFLHWGISLLCSHTGQLLTHRMFPLSNPSPPIQKWLRVKPPFGHLVRIHSCSLRHRWQEQSDSGSPTGMFSTCRIKMIPSRCHGHYKHCKSDSTPKTPESKCGLGRMEAGGHDEPVGWNVIPQSVGMVDSHNRGLEPSSKLCSGKEMFPAVGLT